MISTEDFCLLPDRQTLKKTCKAISVMEAILSQDWQYRYYSYNANWDTDEECLQMRNGSGDEMLILFRRDGCVINGFAHEYEQQNKGILTKNLPTVFTDFIFGEPVKSIGTTFCLWITDSKNWQVGQLKNYKDNSEKMLTIFDGQPKTYINWATGYYEKNYNENESFLNTIIMIYEGKILTRKMVLSLNDDLEDWQQLETDLKEINYIYSFD